MYVRGEFWGIPDSGYSKRKGDNYNTKKKYDQATLVGVANQEWEVVFTDLVKQASPTRLALLWDILFESDLSDLNELEEKIYRYGQCLGAKDSAGRIVFTRMAMVLRSAQNVNV